MRPEHLQIPETFSGEAPLFPLPNVVVFPSSINPLRVFESRYREMFEDAMRGDEIIAMATLLPGYESEYYSRPPIASTVCVGRVGEHRRNDDGTYDFVLVGLQRATIESEITPVRSYRRAQVRLVAEADSATADPALLRQLGEDLIEQAAVAMPAFGKMSQPFAAGDLSLATLTDAIAHHLNLDLPTKLRLLEQASPMIRAELLIENLRSDGEMGQRAPRFSEN